MRYRLSFSTLLFFCYSYAIGQTDIVDSTGKRTNRIFWTKWTTDTTYSEQGTKIITKKKCKSGGNNVKCKMIVSEHDSCNNITRKRKYVQTIGCWGGKTRDIYDRPKNEPCKTELK